MDEYQNGVIGIYYLEKGNRLAENGDGFQGETDQGEKQFGSFIWKTSSRRSGVTAAGGYVLGQIATEFPHTSNNSSFCGCQRRISFHMPVIPPNTSNIHHYHRSFTNFWAARYQTSHLWPKQRSKFAEPAFTGNTHCRGKLFQLRGAVCFFLAGDRFLPCVGLLVACPGALPRVGLYQISCMKVPLFRLYGRSRRQLWVSI